MKYIFYALTAGFFLATACVSEYDAPCRDRVVAKAYVFSDTVNTVIPYSSQDTLLYTTTTGDSLLFFTMAYSDSVTTNISDVPNNPECPNDYESHQTLAIGLADTLETFGLYYTATEKSAWCTYQWGGEKIELPFEALMLHDSTFLDSIQLDTRWFYNVHQFKAESGISVYIHPSLGLLQFTNNTKTFTLQRFNSKPWK